MSGGNFFLSDVKHNQNVVIKIEIITAISFYDIFFSRKSHVGTTKKKKKMTKHNQILL